jgi:hypothetical protein
MKSRTKIHKSIYVKFAIVVFLGILPLGTFLGFLVLNVLGDDSKIGSYSLAELAYPGQYLPAVINLPTPTPTRTNTIIFLGQKNSWDGEGFIRTDVRFDVGIHHRQEFDLITGNDIIRSTNEYWYAPNPQGWGSKNWYAFYSMSSGNFLSSSAISDPAWKFSNPLIMPLSWSPIAGQPFPISGNIFNVSGPFQGITAFGRPITYWRFVNRDRLLYWDEGGEWKQYVNAGELILHYDAGATRLIIYENILRSYYLREDQTTYFVQYITKLTESNAFILNELTEQSDSRIKFEPGPIERGFFQEPEYPEHNEAGVVFPNKGVYPPTYSLYSIP